MTEHKRLTRAFFERDVLDVAPDLIGKLLCRKLPNGEILRRRITETEAYRGTQDTACHAHKGCTERTRVLWQEAGVMYVYLCYGMHNLLNAVTGDEGEPQAVLLRAVEGAVGPGRLTKALAIDRSFNMDSFVTSDELWMEDDGFRPKLKRDTRVGIGYASKRDQARKWRWILQKA